MPDAVRLDAPATHRNRAPIWEVLRDVLPSEGTVLEIASGSGQHAAFFAGALGRLRWQPTDPREEAVRSVDAWCEELPQVLPARRLDVHDASWPAGPFQAAFCANMIHIAPWSATGALWRGLARVMAPEAVVILYGPFFEDERPPAPSNLAFDRSLRERDPSWGVRHRSQVEAEAVAQGFRLERRSEMPANNLALIFRHEGPSRPR